MKLSRGRPLLSFKVPLLAIHRSPVSASRRPTSITILAAVALEAVREVTLLAAPVVVTRDILRATPRTTEGAPQVAEVGHLMDHPVDLVVVVEVADPLEGRPTFPKDRAECLTFPGLDENLIASTATRCPRSMASKHGNWLSEMRLPVSAWQAKEVSNGHSSWNSQGRPWQPWQTAETFPQWTRSWPLRCPSPFTVSSPAESTSCRKNMPPAEDC